MNTLEEHIEAILRQMTLKEKVSLLSGQDAWNTVPISRLGIPSITMTDGPHGVRANQSEAGRAAGYTTAFPTGVSMAASWDPALVRQVGQALADETRAMGCHVLLGPCVNIVRHPLAGRNFESYSEDPYLAGQIGVAYVQGVQGGGVGTSLKHFAANNQEIERFRGSSEVDERTLREIYLAQFERVVKEAQPWTVMCSYNRLNGVYASQNEWLLTDILRDEWDFDGIVVSDWGAVHTTTEAVEAGLDLEMPGPAKYFGRLLAEAVNNWQVEEEVIDLAARRVLRLLFRAGVMDSPKKQPAGEVNTAGHQQLARRLAEEAITLLKNDGSVLPIRPQAVHTLAVIGPNAASFSITGNGSSAVTPPYVVTPLAALQGALGDRVELRYEQGCDNYAELPVIEAGFLTPAEGQGSGLKGEYFSNPTFSGQPASVSTDRRLDFWWFGEGPNRQQRYSIRWTGSLTPPHTGPYLFQLNNTSLARLYLDGRLLLENSAAPQVTHAPAIVTAEVHLERGHAYDLRLEYVKDNDDGLASLRLHFGLHLDPAKDDRLTGAVEAARSADIAVVFAGMPFGYETEGDDRPHMDLPNRQNELIQAVARANPRTVVVLNAGSPVTMPWLDEVAAVLLAYYPGMEGGQAITRILTGEVNPSGKLTVTFPRRLEDTPAYDTYPGGRQVIYGEGLFVGYRYYDRRQVEVLFPFGHGLSYTTFAYSDLRLPATAKVGEPVEVELTLTNTGPLAGKEVVQLYLHDCQAALPRPPQELKGFAKVSLEPGQSQVVRFTLDERSFAFFDPDRGGWQVEPGEFEVRIGSSSRQIHLHGRLLLE